MLARQRRYRFPSPRIAQYRFCLARGAMSKVYREKLIDEVKKYPVLYDTRHENHRDIDVRDRCWAEISERLGENSEILKREWKILRDSLRQSLKKCKQGVTTKAGTPCKKWRFQNRMAFVLPYMTIRRTQRRTRELKIDVADKDVQSDQESEPWEACGDQDSLELFFASVCQSAKRLPKTYQNQLKRQVLDALLRTEEEAEGQETKTGVYRSF